MPLVTFDDCPADIYVSQLIQDLSSSRRTEEQSRRL